MHNTTHISAFISASTRERLERYTEAHGLEKGAVLEAALLHHLRALDELPADVIVPPRLVVAPAALAEIAHLVVAPPAPTEAMVALMAGQPVDGLDD